VDVVPAIREHSRIAVDVANTRGGSDHPFQPFGRMHTGYARHGTSLGVDGRTCIARPHGGRATYFYTCLDAAFQVAAIALRRLLNRCYYSVSSVTLSWPTQGAGIELRSWLPRNGRHPRMFNSLFRLFLALTLVCAFAAVAAAQEQPAQDQSLGDLAKSQRQKKTSGKVIDDEQMAERHASHSAGAGAFPCDDACVAAVKTAVQQDSHLRMTDAQWQTALAAGRDEYAEDSEWSELLTAIRQQVCQRRVGAADPEKAKDLERRVAKKLLDDVREEMDIVSGAMQASANQAAIDRATDAARARAIKLQIIKVQAGRANQPACGQPAASAGTSQTN